MCIEVVAVLIKLGLMINGSHPYSAGNVVAQAIFMTASNARISI